MVAAPEAVRRHGGGGGAPPGSGGGGARALARGASLAGIGVPSPPRPLGDPDYELPRGKLTETQVVLAARQDNGTHIDRYGFIITGEAAVARARAARSAARSDSGTMAREQARLRKWRKMLGNGRHDWEAYRCNRRSKVKRRVRKGIPDEFRGLVWQYLSGGRELMAAHPGAFCRLLTVRNDTVDLEIMRDLNRTFPNHVLFQQRQGPGQQSLFHVLRAYSAFDIQVGYVQGMGFVTAILLMYMSEEEAFWTLVSLLKGRAWRGCGALGRDATGSSDSATSAGTSSSGSGGGGGSGGGVPAGGGSSGGGGGGGAPPSDGARPGSWVSSALSGSGGGTAAQGGGGGLLVCGDAGSGGGGGGVGLLGDAAHPEVRQQLQQQWQWQQPVQQQHWQQQHWQQQRHAVHAQRQASEPGLVLEGLYVSGMPLLQQSLHQMQALVRQELPKLGATIEREGILPSMYCTHWFNTLFGYSLPFEHLLRVWDVLLAEGPKMLFRVGLVLLGSAADQLAGLQFEKLAAALNAKGDEAVRVFPVLRRHPDRLIQSALRYRVSRRLAHAQAEYQQQQQQPTPQPPQR